MADTEDYNEDDLFADIYEDENPSAKAAPVTQSFEQPEAVPIAPVKEEPPNAPIAYGSAPADTDMSGGATFKQEDDGNMDNSYDGQGNGYPQASIDDDNYGPIGIKEDG